MLDKRKGKMTTEEREDRRIMRACKGLYKQAERELAEEGKND